MSQKFNNIIKTVWAYLVITFGCLLYCSAWTQIFIPNGIASGGITGLSTVIQYATGFPMFITYGIINFFLILAGFIIIGKAFGVRTIFALVAITVFLDVLPYFNLPVLALSEKILNPIVASFLEAIGVSMILKYGGSSGGTDIIALIINKFWSVSLGRVYIALDIVIIASLLLIPGKTINDVMYGYISVITFSFALDFFILGSKSSVQVMVFSTKYEEIANFVNHDLHRGATALKAIGWYSQQERNILLILTRRTQLGQLTAQIKEIDPSAFVSVAPVSEVYGEGFEEIKTGFRKRNIKAEQSADEISSHKKEISSQPQDKK